MTARASEAMHAGRDDMALQAAEAIATMEDRMATNGFGASAFCS